MSSNKDIIDDRGKTIIMVTSCFLWYKTTAQLSITVVCFYTEREPLVSKKGKTYSAVRQEDTTWCAGVYSKHK